MTIEPRPGGRGFRDLGNDNGHFWGHVQAIKQPTLLEITGPLCMSYPGASNMQYRLKEVDGGTCSGTPHSALSRTTIVREWRGGGDAVRVRSAGGVPCEDLFREGPELWRDDVRLRSERIEYLPRPRDERRDAARLKCAHDVPCVRSHHAQVANSDSKLLGDVAVWLRGRLEALDGVHRERAIEHLREPGILQLLFDRYRRGVGESHGAETFLPQSLKSRSHVGVGGQRARPRENASSILGYQPRPARLGHHVECGTRDRAEIGIWPGEAGDIRIQQERGEPFAKDLAVAKRTGEMGFQSVDVEHRLVHVEHESAPTP